MHIINELRTICTLVANIDLLRNVTWRRFVRQLAIMTTKTALLATMNTTSLTADNFRGCCEDGNYYVPVVINDTKWVLRFIDENESVERPRHFIAELNFAINVNMGKLSNLLNHLALNGYSALKFEGAVYNEEFLNNLSQHSELDRNLFA